MFLMNVGYFAHGHFWLGDFADYSSGLKVHR